MKRIVVLVLLVFTAAVSRTALADDLPIGAKVPGSSKADPAPLDISSGVVAAIPGARNWLLLPAALLQTTSSPQADWQARYDRALQKKKNGDIMKGIGGTMFTASLVWTVVNLVATKCMAGDLDCNQRFANRYLGSLGLGTGGIIVSLVGAARASHATKELTALETEKTNASGTALFEFSMPGTRNFVLSLGPDVSIRYAMRW